MKKIYLSPPHLGDNELLLVKEAFDNNWVASVGDNLTNFEHKVESLLTTKKAVALNSCTSALHLGLILLGVTRGDEVIVPSFTFVASVNPILYVGATPILVDSEKDSWNMCPHLLREAIENRIRKGKKPAAIILVHLYGMPAKVDEIMAISKEFDIPILEDAAEALGSTYKNQYCGSFGQLGAFSFNGNKIITSSTGGILVCNTSEEKDKVLFLATQAKEDADYYLHEEIGFNYRMSNICAGIGSGQMDVLNDRIAKRRDNYLRYHSLLRPYSSVEVHEEPNSNFSSNFWLTTVTFTEPEMVAKVKEILSHHSIESRRLWRPMHMQPLFKETQFFESGVSQDLFERGLCLPSGTNYSSEDYERIEHTLTHLLDNL